jgi:putative transposase
MRAGLIEKGCGLSTENQCRLLGISRSTAYYMRSTKQEEKDMQIKKQIDTVHETFPTYGRHNMWLTLKNEIPYLTEKQIRRIMHKYRLYPVYSGPNTSGPAPENRKYPYLLRNKVIRYPNQVWCTDITYIKVAGGTVYLMAVMDVFSRKILKWRVFNTMDAFYYAQLLEETIEEYGEPAIFNTDQGAQFTSNVFTGVLLNHGIQISMDGRNRCLDNIYIERFWRTVKYEDIYLRNYETVSQLKDGLKWFINYYNTKRAHQGLNDMVPDEVYQSFQHEKQEVIAA